MASASYPATGMAHGRGRAAGLTLGIALAIFSFLGIYKLGITLMLAGVLALGGLWLLMIKPQMATLLFVALMYSNGAAVAVRSHHVPASLAMGSFVLAFLPMLNYVVVRREGIRTDAVFWLMGIYFTILVVSALVSRNPAESRETLANYILECMVVYFLVLNTVRSPQVLEKAARIVPLVAVFLGMLSTLQYFTHNYERTYGGFSTVETVEANGVVSRPLLDNDTHIRGEEKLRAFGPVADPNFYGQIMAAALPLALIPAITGRTRRARIIALAACLPIVAGVLLSFSRGAAIAMVASLFCMMFLRYLKLWHGLVLAAIIAAVIASNPDYSERIGTLMKAKSEGVRNAEPSVRDRALILQAGTERFLQHPILGVGPGQSPGYIGTYDQVGQFGSVRDVPLHNTYLQQLVETGILGFLCFMAIVFVALRNLLRTSRYWRQRRPQYAHLAAAFMLAIVAFLTACLFLHMPFVTLRYYSLLLGLSGSAVWVYRSEMAATSPQSTSRPPH